MSKRSRSPGGVDPDLPINADGKVYHLACTGAELADRIILVGDPGRVPIVAQRFDKGSLRFENTHREICVMTGTYQGTPVTCLSTGMGTDNVEIVINEIHALKEFDLEKREWRAEVPDVRMIRVGTCGSPNPSLGIGTLAVTRHAIGMDNTCQYYREKAPAAPSAAKLAEVVNATPLGKVGVYTSKAHPDITAALVAAADKAGAKHAVGTTASGSGFYGCQGRVVGRFAGHVTIPSLVDVLGGVRLPLEDGSEERVVNIEMENSAICYLSNILGYKAGTVCAIIAARAGDERCFATPEQSAAAVSSAIDVALAAIVA